MPALHINGSGASTREQAEHYCLAAIVLALQGDPADYGANVEVLTFEVSIGRGVGLTVERAEDLIAAVRASRDAR